MEGIKLKRMNKQQKMLLGIVAVAMVWVFYSYLYSPLVEKISSARQELTEKEEKLRNTESKALRRDQLLKEFELLRQDEKEVEKKLPRNKEIPKLLKDITTAFKKYRVNFNNFSPQAQAIKTYFNEIPFNITVTSSFHNLALFFTEIGQMETIINTQNLQMSPRNPTDEDPSNISASFSIITYTFKE